MEQNDREWFPWQDHDGGPNINARVGETIEVVGFYKGKHVSVVKKLTPKLLDMDFSHCPDGSLIRYRIKKAPGLVELNKLVENVVFISY